MRITEGNSEMIWHSRGMDKDWSSCHSRSEARPRMHGVNSCRGNPVILSLTSAKKELK
jgi:hypothetical protein